MYCQAPVAAVGELTPDGVKKLNELLAEVHRAFLSHVARHRPAVDVKEVGKGKSWLGQDAVLKGLVDDIMHSDAYIRHVIEKKGAFVYLVKRRPVVTNKGRGLFNLFNPTASTASLDFAELKSKLFILPKTIHDIALNLMQFILTTKTSDRVGFVPLTTDNREEFTAMHSYY